MLQAGKAALVIVKQAAKSAITSPARLHRGAHTHSSRMKDLKASSVADFKEWFDGVDAFLCDCDGVLWRGNDGIKFVDDTYKALVASGKRVFFVTNNSTKSRHDYVHKLEEAAGIQCKHDEIISSAYAASVYAKSNGITAAYVLGRWTAGWHGLQGTRRRSPTCSNYSPAPPRQRCAVACFVHWLLFMQVVRGW